MPTDVSIIIPAYNEEAAIKIVLQELVDLDFHNTSNIIVVSDGSTDKTNEIVRDFPVNLKIHKHNIGYGAALKTGIRLAKTDKIITIDGDAQHDPKDIKRMIGLLDDNDMVIGERVVGSAQIKNRIIGKKILKIIGEYLVERKLPDYNSGFRGFDRNIMLKMLHIMPNGFSFSTTSTLSFLKEGHSIGTIPIKTRERMGRTSNVRFFKDGAKTLLLIIRVITLFNPLKVFIPGGVLFSLAGVLYSIWNLFTFGRIPNSGVLFFTTGVIIFFFGILSDQISAIRREKHA